MCKRIHAHFGITSAWSFASGPMSRNEYLHRHHARAECGRRARTHECSVSSSLKLGISPAEAADVSGCVRGAEGACAYL
jgi:hypothetical protein